MKPWYRNSTLQMDDPEMEWLQSKDTASCAVWEWLKSDCQKRDTCEVRKLSEQELDSISRRLGIDKARFSAIESNLKALGWVSPILPNSPHASQILRTASGDSIRGWSKWQERNRTSQEDALRKQVEYWKGRVENQQLTKSLPNSPHGLPKPPKPPQSEERRGDQSTNPPTPQGGNEGADFPECNIPTLDEVTQQGQILNISPEVCKGFFDHHQGNNLWLNRWGKLIDWRHKIGPWNQREQANGHPGSTKGTVSIGQAIRLLEEEVSKHRANPSSVFHAKDATELERADLQAKRRKLKELKSKALANV